MRDINQQLTSKAAYAISQMANGTMLKHDTLMNMLECKDVLQYRSRVAILKAKLIKEHGKFLKTIHKQGYEIAHRGHEIKLCTGEYLAGAKRMAKAFLKTNYIDIEKMDENDRNITLATSNKMGTMIAMLRNGGMIA